MRKYYTSYPIFNNQYTYQNEERFIGPIIPFLGGAIVGYIAGRPQYGNTYPNYYPVYYPYYPYYQQPLNPGNGQMM